MCAVGFGWYRVNGGFRCKGGYHCVTDASLAAGTKGYYACSVWDNGTPRPSNLSQLTEDELLVHKFLNNQVPPLSGDKETIELDGWYWYGPRYKANDQRDLMEMSQRVDAMLTSEQVHQINLARIKIAKADGDVNALAKAQRMGYDISNYGAGAGPRARAGPGAGGGLGNYRGGYHQSPHYRPKR